MTRKLANPGRVSESRKHPSTSRSLARTSVGMYQYAHGARHGKHRHPQEPRGCPSPNRAARDGGPRFCQDHGIQALIELEPREPEDITDIELALVARQPVVAAPK